MYLGLDIGTSGVKGVLINEHQDIRAEATAPLSVSRPHKGWSEQDPETWKTAVDSVMRELRVSADLSGVKGIGLSGQRHGATLVDKAAKALRPSIL